MLVRDFNIEQPGMKPGKLYRVKITQTSTGNFHRINFWSPAPACRPIGYIPRVAVIIYLGYLSETKITRSFYHVVFQDLVGVVIANDCSFTELTEEDL